MNPHAAMYGRTVFPIYNEQWAYLGCTGRTIYPVSEKNPKWKHHNISTGNYFYNLQNMYKINKKQSVILVESCGNVLRLAEAGYLSLGCFGAQLTTQQCIRLEMSNVHTIYLGYDPDEAGKKCSDRAIKKLSTFKVIPIVGMTKDFGDMTIQEIQNLLGEQNVNCTFG
jgi:DNA primase